MGTLLATGSSKASITCSTPKGPCIFPFKAEAENGFIREYTTCTTADGDAQPWCATKVDSNNQSTEMAYCNTECLGVTVTKTMYVHPDNAVNNCKCGVPNTMRASTRIVGDDEVKIGEYPWQVALLYGDSPDTQSCGGTLVGDRYVITAAHCTERDPSAIKVLIGDTNLAIANDTTQFIKDVAEIRQHEDYRINYVSVENDIAVLVLSTPVDLAAYPNIKPACLPDTETVDDLIGERAVVSGWGQDGSGQHLHFIGPTKWWRKGYRSSMAYPKAGHRHRINYFSNPDVMYKGYPTGTEKNNCARVIKENRFGMAALGDESKTCTRR